MHRIPAMQLDLTPSMAEALMDELVGITESLAPDVKDVEEIEHLGALERIVDQMNSKLVKPTPEEDLRDGVQFVGPWFEKREAGKTRNSRPWTVTEKSFVDGNLVGVAYHRFGTELEAQTWLDGEKGEVKG